MDARKLVGMTEWAKKRKARWESNSIMLPWRRAWRAKHGETLRIGQRLRPCPGCHACIPGVKGWHIDKVRGRFKMPTIAWSCDGSGVLPARSRKVRQ